jgi:drug/metabolite transporter (DMT)-like permease
VAAIALALGASLTWGLADFFGPLKGRTFGALRVLVYVQLGGLAAIAAIVAIRGHGPAHAGALLAIPAAISGTLGLYAYYRGVVVGAISIVAPVAGASAAIPVVVGIAAGDRPAAAQLVGIACALVGVALASREPGQRVTRAAAGVGLALVAAIGFGLTWLAMALLVRGLGAPYLAAQLVTTGIVLFWSFLAHKLWTFRAPLAPLP